MATQSVPVVDAWAQHPTPGFVQHEMFASLRRWTDMDEIPDKLPVEVTARLFEEAGYERVLLSAWWGRQGPIISNDEVEGFVEAHPDLFVGVGSVPTDRPMEGVREARRCVDELGFAAIRILPWLIERPPDDRRLYPIYAELVELDVPICLQVGHTGPLRPSEHGRPIPHVDRIALEFPELVIVCGHIGAPWTEEMVSLARKYENVYIDTSAYKPKRYPAQLVEYLGADGADKVLFGTNYPMLTPEEGFEGLDALGLDDATQRAFLRGNALDVFGLDG